MLGTCLHEFGHFFVGKLHFAGKDFLLDAGRDYLRCRCLVYSGWHEERRHG